MPISSKSNIAQRLHILRRHYNLSLQDLADITGISRSNLNRYERGESKPTSEYLKNLCEYYHVSADWLLFGMQSEELKEQGWDTSDPELKAMVKKLSTFMTSENPHVRSWAIVQFTNAFGKQTVSNKEKISLP